MSKARRVRSSHAKGPPKSRGAGLGGGRIRGGPPGGHEHSDEYPEWYGAADAFTEACRLPVFAAISVEESPLHAIDIRAMARDLIAGQNITLRVFWHQPDPGLDPEHWFAVGEATGPAHDVDPEYPELLAGIHPDSREHLRHVLDHLHEMVHDAEEVVFGKIEDMQLEIDRYPGHLPARTQEAMLDHAAAEAMNGLSGIARLYSGSPPEPGEVPGS